MLNAKIARDRLHFNTFNSVCKDSSFIVTKTNHDFNVELRLVIQSFGSVCSRERMDQINGQMNDPVKKTFDKIDMNRSHTSRQK